MTNIVKLDEIDLSQIIFTEPDNNIINISPILFETPELYCIDEIIDINSKHITHELLVTLTEKNKSDKGITKNFLDNLEMRIIEQGKKYSLKKYKSVIMDVEEDSDLYQNGIIKVKFIRNKNFNTLVFDETDNIVSPVDYSDLFLGDVSVKMIMELSSIWIKDGIYSIYLKLHQIKAYKINQDIEYILSD